MEFDYEKRIGVVLEPLFEEYYAVISEAEYAIGVNAEEKNIAMYESSDQPFLKI